MQWGALCIHWERMHCKRLRLECIVSRQVDAFASQSLQTLCIATFLYVPPCFVKETFLQLLIRYEKMNFYWRHIFGGIVLAANAL